MLVLHGESSDVASVNRNSPRVGGSVASHEELRRKYTDGRLSLSPNAKRYIRMVLGGVDPADAGRIVGYGGQTGPRIYHSIIGQEYRAKMEGRLDDDMVKQAIEDARRPMEERVRQILDEESVVTLQTLITLRNSADEKIVLAASKDLLDRAGIVAKSEVRNVVQHEASEGLLAALADMNKSELPPLEQPERPGKKQPEDDFETE